MANSAEFFPPLNLRGLTLDSRLFQAPLAGYSSLPFRLLIARFGAPAMVATEMISAQAVARQSPKQEAYLLRADTEKCVQFQLWGSDPDAFAEAVKIVEQRGANAIDVNCGCPVKKVRAANAGSKLMENPPLIAKIVAAIRRATDLPVSIKIRVGTDDQNYNGGEIAKIAEEAGADFITVHGRHAKERYAHAVRYERIAEIVNAVKIPIIGNGDVSDGASAEKMFAVGCAGAMVGRACMGAPWIFAKISAELRGEKFCEPRRDEIAKTLLAHYDLLAEMFGGDRAIRHTRKLGAFYTRGAFAAKEFRNQMNCLHRREDLLAALDLWQNPSAKRSENN